MSTTEAEIEKDSLTRDGQFYDRFRDELIEFAAQCPADIRQTVKRGDKLTRYEFGTWMQILFKKGWSAPSWPVEVGGPGWDLRQRLIFEEVMAQSHCPPVYHHGVGHIGPVIMQFGSAEQKARFLPKILDGTEWWCQGYSEPASGSDLASLRTAAVLDGDDYVVNGQKLWTSHAHEADMMYLLVRTSKEARKQDGISLLLVPMNTPGIEVRPIRTIDGWHHVNETFLTDVRVPRANLVGQEGAAWRYAKFLLERERLPPASVVRLKALWRGAKQLVVQTSNQQRIPRDLSNLLYRLSVIEGEILGAAEMLKSATEALMRQEDLGMRPSALKLLCGDLAQRITEVALDAVGPQVACAFLQTEGDDVTDAQVWAQNYLFSRSKSIAGGTNEVQRNVMARSLFGD